MKKLLTLIVLIAIGVGGYLWYRGDLDGYITQVERYLPSSKVEIGDNPHLMRFAFGEKFTGGWMLSVPFTRGQAGETYVSAWLGEEKVVDNFPVRTGTGSSIVSNVSFAPTTKVGESTAVRIAASSTPIAEEWNGEASSTIEAKSFTLPVETVRLEMTTSQVTRPLEAMTGGFVAKAYASGSGSTIPDMEQKVNECAPTSAANSLIGLATRNGKADKLPSNPRDVINQLKGDMQWSVANGVVPDDFVAGKDKWAARMGFPIRTEKAGDQDGRGTLREIQDALNKGGAAEMRLRFADANSGDIVTGHMVTVVAVRQVNGRDFIDVHDPLSPVGTDSYLVSEGEVLGYGLWRGPAYVGWGFAQVWEDRGIPMEPMDDQEIDGIRAGVGEKPKVKVIVYGGHYIPVTGVHVGKGPECTEGGTQMPHWHANEAGRAKELSGPWVADPHPDGCGYGKARDIPVLDVEDPR